MVGEQLRKYRKLRHMSQEALAEQMGFPLNTISKIEHGARKVTLEEAVKFAEILQISLEDLAGVTPGSERQVPAAPAPAYTLSLSAEERQVLAKMLAALQGHASPSQTSRVVAPLMAGSFLFRPSFSHAAAVL